MKILVSPFLWFLFLQVAGLLLLLRWGSIERGRALIRLLLVLVFLLAIISTPLSGNWLKNTLSIHPTEKSTTPPVAIFVLAGGYLPGTVRDEDVLGMESQRRVLHAVGIWRCYPGDPCLFRCRGSGKAQARAGYAAHVRGCYVSRGAKVVYIVGTMPIRLTQTKYPKSLLMLVFYP